MHRTKPILRFRVVDRHVMVRVYPKEIRKFVRHFGQPKEWTASHWETVALYLERLCQLLVRNRRRFLARLRASDEKVRSILKDENARFQKELKKVNVDRATKAGHAAHKQDRDAKKQAIEIYNSKKWRTVGKAVEDIVPALEKQQYHYSPVTVGHWIRDYRKSLKK